MWAQRQRCEARVEQQRAITDWNVWTQPLAFVLFTIAQFFKRGGQRLLPALAFGGIGGAITASVMHSLIAGGIAVGMLLAFTRTRPQGEIGDILRGSRGR